MKLLKCISKKNLAVVFLVLSVGNLFPTLAQSAIAPAGNQLRKVQVSEGARVDLVFDAKVSTSQVQLDFFNDIVQLTLTDVFVYPAKISSYSGSTLQKVFAYQYAPRVVRCRFTVKGKAETLKEKIHLQHSGKMLSVWLEGQADKIQSTASKAEEDLRDQSLLQRVMASQPAQPVSQPEIAAIAHIVTKEKEPREKDILGTKKSIPSPQPWRALIMLTVVLGMFFVFVLVLKKIKTGQAGKIANWLGPLKKGKMIEVIATHHLGPKQSIVAVKVSGKVLVLGVSNDSINLITQLTDESKVGELEGHLDDLDGLIAPQPNSRNSGLGAMSAGPAVFSDVLKHETSIPGARARIKSRLEGLKQL